MGTAPSRRGLARATFGADTAPAVLRERTELVRQVIDALNVGDWTSIFPHLAPDVVSDNTCVRADNQGVFHGRDELRQWERWIEPRAAVRIDVLDGSASTRRSRQR
jgi:hypothetical protein